MINAAVTSRRKYDILSAVIGQEVSRMRILFCDDDPQMLAQLQAIVQEFFMQLGIRQPEMAAYQDGEELLAQEQAVDIAFLDVEMPGISGIHIGAALKKRNPYVKIFIVTAYPDYLDEAMRFQVYRYLSKPIDKNRLFRNLRDAVRQYNIDSQTYAVETRDGIEVLRAEEIICVEVAQRKTLIYTTRGILQSVQTMRYWLQTLKLPCFFETHRSYIVNMRYVNAVSKDQILLKYFEETKTAYLTRRKFTLFKDTYLSYLESVK